MDLNKKEKIKKAIVEGIGMGLIIGTAVSGIGTAGVGIAGFFAGDSAGSELVRNILPNVLGGAGVLSAVVAGATTAIGCMGANKNNGDKEINNGDKESSKGLNVEKVNVNVKEAQKAANRKQIEKDTLKRWNEEDKADSVR